MMNDLELRIGDKVYFGRKHGEQTYGEIVKVNRVKVKVKQLDQRGTYRSYAVGTIWTVPLSLLTKADGTPVVTAPAPVAQPAAPARSEAEIMRQVLGLYSSLSPENLFCDGELSRAQAGRRAVAFRQALRACFRELGRTVSEDEAYAYADRQRQLSGV
jgi:hypothetical protein